MMKEIFKIIRNKLLFLNKNKVKIIIHPDFELEKEEILRKVVFFFPNIDYEIRISKSFYPILSTTLYFGFNPSSHIKKIYSGYLFDINKYTNSEEAWVYHYVLNQLSPTIDFNEYKRKIIDIKERFKKINLSKAYFFGTGPSLEKAIDYDWSDGIRIVCNTIVKDKELWSHLNPNIIVAGDAIYHFGIGEFAKSFREDLRKRMNENLNTIFIYPSIFHSFCIQEFNEFKDRMIPIPILKKETITHDLTINYYLPNLPNVLPLLGLPLACTFSKNVCLWGFDGKAPNDKDFWKNSDAHFYQALVPELKLLHPAFYSKSLSDVDPLKYIKEAQGDKLDKLMTEGEKNGYVFNMLHHSYTPTLAKRLTKFP